MYLKRINFANIAPRKNRNACFRCTVKTCRARIETNDVIVVAKYGDHDHSDKVSNIAAVLLRVSCKRSAANDISQRPCKIIRTALQSAVSYIRRVAYRFAPQCFCSVFATSFILCMTDTDDVALSELQIAVLLILHLRFC